MKRPFMALFIALILSVSLIPAASADETRIEPAWPVPDYVTWLLEVASGEIGYREGDHGWSKYGEWAGDPYAQWCAEFLCWCVNRVDEEHGTHLLNDVYPMYSGSNTGRSWFVSHGRYLVRWGNLDGWGYQWLTGSDHFLTTGDYIPQPGDWVFFTWTSDLDTDHVALVEYCTRDDAGNVTIHCIEGNTPVAVKRAEYDLTYSRILGYGTVHDACNWTIRSGCSGMKVRQLQEKLVRLGRMDPAAVDGVYGSATIQTVKDFQAAEGLPVNGIANIATQNAIDRHIRVLIIDDPTNWLVTDSSVDDPLSLDDFCDVSTLLNRPAAAPDEDFDFPADADWMEESAPDDLQEDSAPDWIEENP